MKYDLNYIEKIAKIVKDNQLTEITLEDGEKAITVRKEGSYCAPVVQSAPASSVVSTISSKEEKQVSAETAARNAFENMAYRDAKNIIMSRMKGDIETLITFYDNIYKGLQSEKKAKESINENTVFPPKAIKGGNYSNACQKQAGYENFI